MVLFEKKKGILHLNVLQGPWIPEWVVLDLDLVLGNYING
jgi:hypothetical protein